MTTSAGMRIWSITTASARAKASDEVLHPGVLVGDEERRAVGRQVLGDLVGVLLVQGAGLDDVDLREGCALGAEVLDGEGGDVAVGVLDHEQDVNDADDALADLVEDGRHDLAAELVAREADDVDVDGTEWHGGEPPCRGAEW